MFRIRCPIREAPWRPSERPRRRRSRNARARLQRRRRPRNARARLPRRRPPRSAQVRGQQRSGRVGRPRSRAGRRSPRDRGRRRRRRCRGQRQCQCQCQRQRQRQCQCQCQRQRQRPRRGPRRRLRLLLDRLLISRGFLRIMRSSFLGFFRWFGGPRRISRRSSRKRLR
jgi:hypothetical protein